jgi:hypothetical protein
MPIVFVHGVNTRSGPSYDAGVQLKTKFFQQYFAGATINKKVLGQTPAVHFPYWGDLATQFAWNMASLPHGQIQALGVATDEAMRASLAHVRDALSGQNVQEPLLALARNDFGGAVEFFTELVLEYTASGKEAETADFVLAAQRYAMQNPKPVWLGNIATDQQFVAELAGAVQAQAGVQAQGIGQILNSIVGVAAKLKKAVRDAVGTAIDRAGNFLSTKLLASSRESLNGELGRFFGDVFIYLDKRGTVAAQPGVIGQTILKAIDDAIKAAPNEPLVIVGHSLGGVVTYDLLGFYRPDIKVDLFVTVGSQIGHFEEMKLFRLSDPAIRAPAKATPPPNVLKWINVYDIVDIFSYALTGIFDRFDFDGEYDTKTYVIKAHSAYFNQARLYERLRARIDQLP